MENFHLKNLFLERLKVISRMAKGLLLLECMKQCNKYTEPGVLNGLSTRILPLERVLRIFLFICRNSTIAGYRTALAAIHMSWEKGSINSKGHRNF